MIQLFARPFRWLNNSSLKQKLLFFVAALILLMICVAVFARYQVAIIQTHYIPMNARVREMEIAISEMRLYEQRLIAEANSPNDNFYLTRQSPNMVAWRQNFEKYERSYEGLIKANTDTSTKKDLQAMHKKMLAYREAFAKLESVYRQRGFQSFGRIGEVGRRSDRIAAMPLTTAAAQQQRVRLLLAEQEFILGNNSSAIQQFDTASKQLEQLVGPADRIILGEYVALFYEIVALNKVIGLTNNEGLRGDMTKLTGEVIPYVGSIEHDVLQASAANIRVIPRLIDAAALILAMVALAAVLLITRYISLRLRNLEYASESIARGDFTHQVKVDSKDELGRLAASFNAMVRKLAANQLSLHERAHELSESVRLFELVSRAVREAIYEWDVKKGTFKWGEGLTSVFGYHKDKRIVPIAWWTDRIHPEDAEAINASLSRHIQRRSSTWKAVYRFKKASGQYAYCQDRGFIEYENGEAVRMVGSLIDVTRQRQLSRAKDEFLSIASHQLRTPLGSIRWNLELLQEQNSSIPKDAQEFVQEAYSSTLRMLNLVGDLLSVARIEQGRIKHIPEPANLANIIKMAIKEMQPLAKQRHIQIDTSDVIPANVVIDTKQFREVIQNLLSNAVKYSNPRGKVTVAIKIKSKEVIISVSDNGLGIPLEDQDSLFTKFFRAKNVTATDTEGSGLGLFVVKSYVESWGGRIWFDSKENHGTTFFITVPYVKPTAKSKK